MRVAAGALLLFLATTAPPLGAQNASRLWRPDERVVITDLSAVEALAATVDRLYVVTRNGLGMYDRRFHRWEPAVTPLDGYPVEPALAALADPLDQSLWIGTTSGLVHYQPDLRTFERIAVPGGAGMIMFDSDDAFRGVYAGGGAGWDFVPRGALIAQPADRLPDPGHRVRSLGVQEALARIPFQEARSPMALTDERLRRYHYTSAAKAPESEMLYFGTDGMGVIEVDPVTASTERLETGILDASAGAVAVVPGGVWVGTGPRAARVGLSFVAQDLERFETTEGPAATGFAFTTVWDLAARGRRLVLATDRGPTLFDLRDERVAPSFVTGVREAFALAQSAAGVWVGTDDGLFLVDDTVGVHRIDSRVRDPIYSLAASHDTVWVGGARGLGVTWVGADGIKVPAEASATPDLRATIVGLALLGDTVVAATEDRLVWQAGGNPWVIERPVTGELGTITALAADPEGVWVGGVTGLALYRPASRSFVFFDRPDDLPHPVRDLAVDRTYLWVATDGGVVRFTRDAIVR